MEGPVPVPAQTTPTQLQNPPTKAQCPPPKPPAPSPAPPLTPKTKKRPLDTSVHIHNPRHFKMRAVLKLLRPHFLEVLRTPDFRNCKAAHEIQEQTKLLMELYKEITAETVSIEESKNVPESQPLSGENRESQKPQEQVEDPKPTTEQPETETVFSKSPETETVFSKSSESKSLLGVASEKQHAEDGQIAGTYVVGGSAFGWNFITYLGNESVYCGVTKESFRASNPAK